MGQRLRPLAWLMLAGLAACDGFLKEDPTEKSQAEPPRLTLSPISITQLPGWQEGQQQQAWQAMRRSCDKFAKLPPQTKIGTGPVPMTAADWAASCGDISLSDGVDAQQARQLLEQHFSAYLVSEQNGKKKGLFTGYFEAELEGARTADANFAHPIYAKPADLVSVDLGGFAKDLKGRQLVGQVKDGKVRPYPTRGTIEAGLLDGKKLELAYAADPVDVFLLQVQGSGRVKLTDGTVMRVGFAAHNGQPYKSIGRHLIDLGELKPHEASWDGIRRWLVDNPGKQKELFAVNPRFIFFREIKGEGPIGSQGVALSPGRSLAVDRRHIPMGVPVWLDTVWPSQHDKPLRRLMVAQDTGGAIKGVVRGDFFWGYGDEALKFAGRMKSPGSYYLLLPKHMDQKLVQLTQ